ncbi:MAG TPA: sigma-70 family RNA polymerase sigma factor [Sunxiuqinia sp.]|nr:sigma-70 family RNA polymerase sigma factor [Sunxiuqinia sp.]
MTESTQYRCDPDGWVKAYADELFRFAYFRVNNHEQAEDLVQETFLSALNSLGKFRNDCTEKTWLYNILKNKIIDFYRKNGSSPIQKTKVRNTETDEDFFNHFFNYDAPNQAHWNPSAAPNEWAVPADDLLVKAEFMLILQTCLSYLPETQADVFRLKNIDDLKTDEICKELNISSSNLWVLIHRAKLQLRECLEKNWQRYE